MKYVVVLYDGMSDYPVFTRKVHTDLSYIACAKKLLAAPEQIYPQFATHNAQTLATIYHLADPARYYAGQYEFQCLHGMGEPLYENVVGSKQQQKLGVPCRIYAPVGNHETLLAYLVRRLLENGANTSFVNQIADDSIDINALVEKMINPDVPLGYTSLVFIVSVYAGVQLIAIGMVGEYLGRIFMANNKKPQYSIRKSFIKGTPDGKK